MTAIVATTSDAAIKDHPFVGRRWSLPYRWLPSRRFTSCGQSCGTCGHQWHEHAAVRGDRVTAFAMAFADVKERYPASWSLHEHLARLPALNIFLRRDMAIRRRQDVRV